MIIPVGFAHVQHIFEGTDVPLGAAVTYGVAPNGGSFDPGDAALLHGFFGTRIMPELTVGVSLVRTIVKYGPNETGPVVEATGTVAGGVDEEATAPNTAYLVRKRTALGGRRNRGRFFLPGVAEAIVTGGGALNPLTVTSIQTALNSFLADIDAEAMDMVILHNSVQTPTTVTSLTLDTTVATQRRRLR